MIVVALIFWLSVALVVYIYAGYPLLVSLLSHLRAPRRKAQGHTPDVTLLISALDEQAVIAARLDNALALDYPRERLQIIVAADGSNDATADIVRDYADRGVELVHQPRREGKMAAINRAMRQARGDVIVFSDANNHYDRDALREIVAPFADVGVGVVSGAKTIVAGDGALGDAEGRYWKYESWIKRAEARLGCCTSVAGEVMAIRRDLFEPAPHTIINDDFYMAMRIARLGYRIDYAERARSRERVSPTAQHEVARRARIVAGRYQAIMLAHRLLAWRRPIVAWQVVSHKFVRPLVPLAMMAALLTNLSAMIWPTPLLGWPVNAVMLALQALFYITAAAGMLVPRQGRVGRYLYLATFLCSSNFAAALGLWRALTGRQKAAWDRIPRREGFANASMHHEGAIQEHELSKTTSRGVSD